MTGTLPTGDAERVLISREHSPLLFGALWPAIIAGISVYVGARLLAAGRIDAPLGALLILLPLLGALVWWRWGTPLRRVVATPTGLLVSSGKSELFVPYQAVASTRQSWLRGGALIVTVALREPVAELRQFAFVVQKGIELPTVAELARHIDAAKQDGGGAR